MDRSSDERGQAFPFLVVLLFFVAVLAGALVTVGRAAVDRAQARTAADAGALAAAGADAEVAAEVVGRNGAELASLTQHGNEFRAITTRGDAQGAATAERIDPPPIEGTGARAGLAPAMLAVLARADELLGVEVPITSGYRSIADQQRLWDNRHTNPYPVARPGTSRHHDGLAVDVPSSFVPRLLGVAAQAGLCQPLPQTDPIHFEVCGGR